MIRRTYGDKWLLITQAEHSRLAGVIAASWNFGGPRPRDEVLYAIAHHDDGWKSADDSIDLSDVGIPRAFNEFDVLEHLGIWSSSVHRFQEDGKTYASALAAAHFVQLAKNFNLARMKPRVAAAVGKFMAEQSHLITRWHVQVANESAQANFREDLRFLQVCDQLSLLLCMDFGGEKEIERVPYCEAGQSIAASRKMDSFTLLLSPLPFAKNLRGLLNAIAVPRRVYESRQELQDVIDSARRLSLEVHIGADANRLATQF